MAQIFHGFQGPPRKGNGQFPGLGMLDTATLASVGCQSRVKPGADNGTKQTNWSSVPGMLTLTPFPTIIVLNDLGGAMIWWHRLGHLSWSEGYLLPTCSPTRSLRIGQGTGLRNGGKLATARKTCEASQHAKQRLETELL